MTPIAEYEDKTPLSHNPKTSSTSSSIVDSFDDAFEDGEDDSFEFSPAVIRAELAKSMGTSVADYGLHIDDEFGSLAAQIGFSDPDASAPTFDVGRRSDEHADADQLSPPTQQPSSSGSQTPSHLSPGESFDDVNLTSEFSSISLESPHPDDHGEDNAEAELPHNEEHEDHFATYPAAQLDIREDPDHAAMRIETPMVDTARSPSPSTTISHDEHPRDRDETATPLPVTPRSSGTPRSGDSVSSTASLPLPPSESAPVPSTSRSHEASASHSSFFKHRPTKSIGPSMLDKVVSKTRPTYLPPKPRTEDKKHMHDWEIMMKRSKAAGESDRVSRLASSIIVNHFSMLLVLVLCCHSRLLVT